MKGCIIFCRASSRRLPNKWSLDVTGRTLLARVCDRILFGLPDWKTVIATSDQESDDPIVNFAMQNGITYFRGSMENVFDRCLQCCRTHDLSIVARVCADRPFVDTTLLDSFGDDVASGFDLVTNRDRAGRWPKGLLTEVFSRKALERASLHCITERQAEHLTEVFYANPTDFLIKHEASGQDRADISLAVDCFEDLERIRSIAKAFAHRRLETVSVDEIYGL